MSKSQFDFSKIILSNAQKLGKEPIWVDVDDLIYTKKNLDESLVEKYMNMNTCPPPILVVDVDGEWLKIVDGHHRVEAQKRKDISEIQVFLSR